MNKQEKPSSPAPVQRLVGRWYCWTSEIKSGWMVFSHGRPYWPLFPTRAKAREYRKWKTLNSPTTYVDRIEVEEITRVKHRPSKIKNV